MQVRIADSTDDASGNSLLTEDSRMTFGTLCGVYSANDGSNLIATVQCASGAGVMGRYVIIQLQQPRDDLVFSEIYLYKKMV